MAPSEGRTRELELVRGEEPPLHAASGFVVGAMMSGIFWVLVGVAVWLLI